MPELPGSRNPTSPLSAPPAAIPLRILLVDDHALFLEGIQNLLSSEGIRVVGMAQDGLEALALARRLRPDLILMDIQMPKCGGLAATRLIKAEMPECKIVILTMSEDEQDLFEAVKSGASGYLLTRLKAAEFFSYLADLQAGHPPFSPGLAEKILQEFTRQTLRSGSEPLPDSTCTTDTGDDPVAEPLEAALSPRQVQILVLLSQGQPYREIAETLGIAERTVKYHMAEILATLHLQNRSQVIAYAARMGLSRPGP